MADIFQHNYSFDPSYGYDLEQLQKVAPGIKPTGFSTFWKNKYQQALQVKPYVNLQDTEQYQNNWHIFDCYYDSTDDMRIGGWLLLPTTGIVENAIIWVHGYGGIETPDTNWNLHNTALLIPCIRGIGRSKRSPISDDPYWHVQHNIQDKHQYIIGGCVQDIWCAVTMLTNLYPQVKARIALMGSSFGGGLSVFATAFDQRICRGLFHVPTFGNTTIRLQLPTHGSTRALQDFNRQHPELIVSNLPYFDASIAAHFIQQPTLWALTCFDPFVAPPGQFSIYNACIASKELFLLQAGHFTYKNADSEQDKLRLLTENFFTL